MSEFGIKIKNFEAGSIFGYNLGTRKGMELQNAMLTNSLFSDFLLENGLDVYKGESTRDIICIEFNYGQKSYKETMTGYNKEIRNLRKDGKYKDKVLTREEKDEKIRQYEELKIFATENKDKYIKKSRQQLRTMFYVDGVDISYNTYNKKGEVSGKDVIHYKMLYRTPGKAKKGSCMFICDRLYEIARDFLYMGIQLPEKNTPIVEIGAYAPLITSSIVGRVKIDPKNILVVNDVDAYFYTKVISIETDENKHCIAVPKDNYRVKNTLFDGQALIDTSIFPDWADGYILLRHHFCKMAAFHSNIQLFMKDYYGDDYETATVTDMFGNEHFVKDVKLITTDNAMKWLKFDVTYDYWCDKVRENGSLFGIVKTAHQSKLGEVQRMSYQMINALEMDIMPEVVQCSMDYIKKLKTDDEVFLDYLSKNSNFSNDFEVLVALVKHNPEFVRSEYFRDRKKEIIRTYVLNFKNGRIIQNADNLVIVGSPYAMLLHSVGDDVHKDDTFTVEPGAIQCYTQRFADGEYLAEFRNPFNSKNNMGHLHNVYSEKMQRYFNFGKLIIAVNMIGTDFQDRNNGSDQDSDSLYVTNHEKIVECAKHCYTHYATIVNNIPMEKNHYDYSLENYAAIDNNLMAAQLAIGESSNLAQICLTYTYNFEDQKYKDYVCILSVHAQIAIDNAKRRYDIDLNDEIARIKNNMDLDQNKYPSFWSIVKPDFNTKKIDHSLKCPMNYIYDIKMGTYRNNKSTLPMDYFFISHPLTDHHLYSRKVESLIQKYSLELLNYNIDDDIEKEDYFLLRHDFDQLINDIHSIYISRNYLGLMSWLINRAWYIGAGVKSKKNNIMQSTIDKNQSLLLKTLYTVNKDLFLKCFKFAND